MTQEKVSVIIPTFNRCDKLLRAIKSVLAQTYENLEIIIVDDASEDNTVEMVSGLRDERIRYMCHSENRGVAAAFNTGIRTSRGRYIAFLGDDDRLLPTKTERQVDILRRSPPSVGLVYCGSLFVDEENGRCRVYEPRGRYRERFYLRDFAGATCLIKRECFQKVGLFDENLDCLVDWDMTLRISEYYDFEFFREPLYVVNVHKAGRVTDNLGKMIKALDRIFSKHSRRIDMLPRRAKRRAYSMYHQERGDFLSRSGMSDEGQREFWSSILLDPLNIKSWVLFSASLGGPRSYEILENLSSALGRVGVLP